MCCHVLQIAQKLFIRLLKLQFAINKIDDTYALFLTKIIYLISNNFFKYFNINCWLRFLNKKVFFNRNQLFLKRFN